MRYLKYALIGIFLLLIIWWAFNDGKSFFHQISHYVENGEVQTLEARYSPEQIMEQHRAELLGNTQRSYKDPVTAYYPYLLMDVKYIGSDRKPKEGAILWGMVDGEMVLNTDNWEQTHGFEDAINANATANDFKILNNLARSNGSMTRDQLQKELQLEDAIIEAWIESAKQKHLIVLKGNEVILHFENPKISVAPQTKMNHLPVSKSFSLAQKMGSKYSQSQIERVAKASFGTEFTIRNASEVYLPVYRIEVLNPDGSILTSYWNALNGQRLNPKYLSQNK
jgi:hypothetical protein